MRFSIRFLSYALVAALLGTAGCRNHAPSPDEIVLECEAFTEKGGWSVDSQFIDQMGSPYLLAHGLGHPVADAKTRFAVRTPGLYNVYARTRNWTGFWSSSAAGRFRLVVNGRSLETDLGVGSADWIWALAGAVKLSAGTNEVSLTDLTGFDGRCDAVAIVAGKRRSEDLDALRASRMRRTPVDERSYDLVVIGGGIAGICTAVTASRSGLRVALVQDRPLLGGSNSSEVRVHLGAYLNLPPYPRLGDVLAEFAPEKGGNAMPAANYEDGRKLQIVRAEKNIELFLNTRVTSVEKNGDSISSVTGVDVLDGRRTVFRAPLFADTTGDGTVGFLAGADYRQGREARNQYDEPLAPEKADKMTMGASVQWYADRGAAVSRFPSEPWMLPFDEKSARPGLRGDWDWENGLGRDQIVEAERIRDYGLLVVYSNWSYLKNRHSKKTDYGTATLSWVAQVSGRRETRRLMGDFVLTERHLLDRDVQKDGTCTTTWTIDQHFPLSKVETGFDGEPFRAESRNEKIWPYPIPYRCFYSRNVSNLFMAGRDISVSHVALGTTRLMRTIGMMGEVVGMAAAVCKERSCKPRDVYRTYLKDLQARMTKGVGDGKVHARQDYNVQASLDPEVKAKYMRGAGLVMASGSPYGVCSHFYGKGEDKRTNTFRIMKDAGIDWVRTDFAWTSLEKETGKWDFSDGDALVAHAGREGVRLLPILDYDHPRARPIQENVPAWREYVRKTVSRFGKSVRHFEVWNEPNTMCWGRPSMPPEHYLRLLKGAYEEIKAIDPGIAVGTAGFSGVPLDYIDALYELGAAGCFDFLCIHPYTCPLAPEGRLDLEIEALREVMAKHGDAAKPLWVTEIGWSTEAADPADGGTFAAGLRIADPRKGKWRVVFCPIDMTDPELSGEIRSVLLKTLPKGSSFDVCTVGETRRRLAAGEVDGLLFVQEMFPAGMEDEILAFVRGGGTLVTLSGMPLWQGYSANEDGTMTKVKSATGGSLRKALRIATDAVWSNPNLEGTIKVKPAKGVRGVVTPPDGFRSSRFLTDKAIEKGDRFIPLLVGPDRAGNDACAAAVYKLKEGGAVVVSAFGAACPRKSCDEDAQKRMAVRALAILLAEGVERAFWYDLDAEERVANSSSHHYGIVHADFSPKPAHGGIAQFTRMRPTGSDNLNRPWHNDGRTVYFPQWKRPDGSLAGMVWTSREAREALFSFKGTPTFADVDGTVVTVARDSDGNYRLPLSGSPLYFSGAEAAFVK